MLTAEENFTNGRQRLKTYRRFTPLVQVHRTWTCIIKESEYKKYEHALQLATTGSLRQQAPVHILYALFLLHESVLLN